MEEILLALEKLSQSEDAESIPDSVWSNCESVISDTFVPKLTDGNDRPCEESDFEEYKPIAKRNTKALKTFLTKIQLVFPRKPKIRKSFMVSLMLLCGEHGCDNTWTTSETVALCRELLNLLCALCGCKKSDTLLVGETLSDSTETGALFKPALVALRPKLLKDSWKCYPAAVACYKWLLLQVKSPHLSDHLNIVLPTALIILDDYVPQNRICGIMCIHHIVENVTRTSLCWYGQGDVIYKALEPILYLRELVLVRPVISCVVAVLAKVEGGPDKDDKRIEWSKYDDSLLIILQTMELEQHCDLRLAYIESLPLFLDSMSLGLARWSKRLLHVLQEYLEVASYSNMDAAKHALLALQVYFKKCQPRIPHHCQVLLSMLLRMLYDVTSNSKETGVKEELDRVCEDVLHLVEECLTTVVQNAPKQAQLMCKDIKTQARFNKTFTEVLDRVFV